MGERPTTRGEATGGPVGDVVAKPAPPSDADPFGAEDLRRASARMQQYARWASPPNLLFAALLVAMYPYTESVLTLILAVLLLGNAACALVAHRLAARRRPAAAVLWQGSPPWPVGLLPRLSLRDSALAPGAVCAILSHPPARARGLPRTPPRVSPCRTPLAGRRCAC